LISYSVDFREFGVISGVVLHSDSQLTGEDWPDVQEQLGSEQLMKTSSPRTSEFSCLQEGQGGTFGERSSVRKRSDRSSPTRRRSGVVVIFVSVKAYPPFFYSSLRVSVGALYIVL